MIILKWVVKKQSVQFVTWLATSWMTWVWFLSRTDFLFAVTSRTSLVEQLKLPESKVDYSRPPSANVRNAWSHTSTPPYACMASCFNKAHEQVCQYRTFKIYF
jgi:hypothetical protein